MNKRFGVAVCVATLLVPALPALADRGYRLEPADVGGRLDMTSIIYGHHNRAGVKRVYHYVSMRKRWKASMLDGEHRVIYLLFDTRPRVGYDRYSRVTERYVSVFSARGRVRARLYNGLGDPPKPLGNVRVRHSGSGLTVELPLKRLRRHHLKSYKWAFETVFSRRGSRHCPLKDPCIDRTTGDHGHRYFIHDLSAKGNKGY